MSRNGSEFKRNFTLLLKGFYIKPVYTTIKNPQTNAQVDRVYQVIYNMLVTKDLDTKVFEYIYQWGETLDSIAWLIRASYNCTIGSTTGQYVPGRYTILNLASIVDWKVITTKKQKIIDIDNDCKNARQFSHDYAVENILYVD